MRRAHLYLVKSDTDSDHVFGSVTRAMPPEPTKDDDVPALASTSYKHWLRLVFHYCFGVSWTVTVALFLSLIVVVYPNGSISIEHVAFVAYASSGSVVIMLVSMLMLF